MLLLLLQACSSDTLTQGGHTLVLEETESRKLGYGLRHGVDLTLDGESLALSHWYTPLSPPMAQSPRIFYWGGGHSPETWEWETWQVFQVKPSSPAQHQAAKEFLDEGTRALFKALVDTPAYTHSYARPVFVLWSQPPQELLFTAPSGDAFRVTDTGAIFMDGALIGRLEQSGGVVVGVEINLVPHTFGSGPAEIRVEPQEQDFRAYRDGAGQDLFAVYGVAQASP